jgi:hypothetical protein
MSVTLIIFIEQKQCYTGDLTMTRVTHISHRDETFTEDYDLVYGYQHSGTACCFHFHSRNPSWAKEYSSVPKTETAGLSSTCHIPEDSNCHGHCCQNYKSHKMFPGLMKNSLTISVSMTFSKAHSRLMTDGWTHPANLTHQHNNKASSLETLLYCWQ